MVTIENKVDIILKNYGMHPTDIDLEQVSQTFIDEMEHGLQKKESSLIMIPTYIEIDKAIPTNERVLVIDAGGTNFRVATVYFTDDLKPVIENYSLYPMPGSKNLVSKEEFFSTIARYIESSGNLKQKMGLCFSYPSEILPNKDGKLIKFSKEIKTNGVEGELIGSNLINVLKKKNKIGEIHIVLLNDTVATLLAGMSFFKEKKFDNYIGFILGTGTNSCYVEKNREITKIEGLVPDKKQIINVESGAFGKAPRGEIDKYLDASTVDPGNYTFEKMISGGYFGALCFETFKFLEKEKIFSKNFISCINTYNTLETKDVSDFFNMPYNINNKLGKCCYEGNENDFRYAYYMIDRLIERASKLTAINISSVILKSNSGLDPLLPVLITAEGTTFYDLKSLRERIMYYLKSFLRDTKKRYYEIVRVKNAPLIGAAIAGLTN